MKYHKKNGPILQPETPNPVPGVALKIHGPKSCCNRGFQTEDPENKFGKPHGSSARFACMFELYENHDRYFKSLSGIFECLLMYDYLYGRQQLSVTCSSWLSVSR